MSGSHSWSRRSLPSSSSCLRPEPSASRTPGPWTPPSCSQPRAQTWDIAAWPVSQVRAGGHSLGPSLRQRCLDTCLDMASLLPSGLGWLSGRRHRAGAQPGAAVGEGTPPSAALGLLPCSAGLCPLRLSSPRPCSPCTANWPWSLHLGVSDGARSRWGPRVGHLRPSGDWPRGSTDTFPSSGLGVRPQPGVQGLLLVSSSRGARGAVFRVRWIPA